MAHLYECPDCGKFKPNDDYDFPSDPKTRKCPKCGGHEGHILYHGITGTSFYAISDHMDPIVSQENGKVYDSRSKYYADLKASGHVIVEAGMENKSKETRGDFDVTKELKQAAREHGLVG